jgi:hypothetical protein
MSLRRPFVAGAGTLLRRNIHPNLAKFQKLQEEVNRKPTKKLDAQGFASTLNDVRVVANQLLAAHGGGEVGGKWAKNLIRRKPEIKSQMNRQRDYQRVLCSNLAVISPRFDVWHPTTSTTSHLPSRICVSRTILSPSACLHTPPTSCSRLIWVVLPR